MNKDRVKIEQLRKELEKMAMERIEKGLPLNDERILKVDRQLSELIFCSSQIGNKKDDSLVKL